MDLNELSSVAAGDCQVADIGPLDALPPGAIDAGARAELEWLLAARAAMREMDLTRMAAVFARARTGADSDNASMISWAVGELKAADTLPVLEYMSRACSPPRWAGALPYVLLAGGRFDLARDVMRREWPEAAAAIDRGFGPHAGSGANR